LHLETSIVNNNKGFLNTGANGADNNENKAFDDDDDNANQSVN